MKTDCTQPQVSLYQFRLISTSILNIRTNIGLNRGRLRGRESVHQQGQLTGIDTLISAFDFILTSFIWPSMSVRILLKI